MRILIVEDEPFIALDLESALNDLDHEVVGVADTKTEALRLARESGCDAALVDMRLRDGFTGPEIADVLSGELAIPFAFVTGNVEQLPPGRHGARAVVAKPFTKADIEAAIRDFVANPA